MIKHRLAVCCKNIVHASAQIHENRKIHQNCRFFSELLVGFIALFIPLTWSIHACAALLHPDAHDIAATGIKTTVLTESLHAQGISAQGTVLDPAAIMQTASRLVTADANVVAARAEMVFTSEQAAQNRKLYTQVRNISLSKLQQSIATAASAAAALTAAKAKLAAERAAAITQWGGVMIRAIQDNAPIMSNIASGAIAVIGVSMPPGSALSQLPATATANLAGRTYDMALIGGIPGMFGNVPGEAMLYSMPAQRNLPIGTYLNVGIATGSETKGVIVPASAIIWEDGKAIAYRVDADGSFEQVDVSTASPVNGGYFIASGLTPGDHIVTQGAELLAEVPSSLPITKAKAGTIDPDDD